MFLRNVIAVFMALVIANPACCCAFRVSLGHSSSQTNSCCSGKSKESKDKDGKSCTCSLAKIKAAPEAKYLVAANGGSHPLPPVPEPLTTEDPDSGISGIIVFLKKWPPDRMPVPTTGSRLAARCSYLI